MHLDLRATHTGSLQNDGSYLPTTSPATSGPAVLLPDPSPMLGADAGAEIAALAVKCGQAERDLNTKAAETEDAVQDHAEQDEVTTLHDEASSLRAGAWTSGLLQVGAGLVTMGAAGATADASAAGAASAAKNGAAAALFLKGAADGLNGGSALAGGLSKAAATDSEALSTAQKALADSAQRSGSSARDAQKNASDFVQAAVDFYREYEATKAASVAAALHGA